MKYGKFPDLNRWLCFENPYDMEEYQKPKNWRNAQWFKNLDTAREEFETLICKRSAEQALHSFLEKHPYFLPGFGDLHHGPYEGIIATKFALGRSFVTDFAYITSNSQTLFFTCVEIESARKRLFRTDGKFHRDYLDARQQIVDWIHWANQNAKQAIECWGAMFNGKPARWFDIKFRGFLVFGRRSELDTSVKQERWSAEAASLVPGLQTMTYDRLLRHVHHHRMDVDNAKLAVCSFRDRRFHVKNVIS